jgi:hypothetical protein
MKATTEAFPAATKSSENTLYCSRDRDRGRCPLPSSGSGPTRLAAELGDVLLQPSKNTTTNEGERFEAVRVRVVVSRFAAAQKSGAGVVIDGWQYELYATDLPTEAWPAAEIVELYYGRCGQENRFAQEDNARCTTCCRR